MLVPVQYREYEYHKSSNKCPSYRPKFKICPPPSPSPILQTSIACKQASSEFVPPRSVLSFFCFVLVNFFLQEPVCRLRAGHLIGCGKKWKIMRKFSKTHYAEESDDYAEKTPDYAEIYREFNAFMTCLTFCCHLDRYFFVQKKLTQFFHSFFLRSLVTWH